MRQSQYTGTRELLRASHIIPWSIDATIRLDPTNGLCLNALHDAAFDRGLMTFDQQTRLVISKTLRSEMPADLFSVWFARYEGVGIEIPDRFAASADALNYHREKIFVGV